MLTSFVFWQKIIPPPMPQPPKVDFGTSPWEWIRYWVFDLFIVQGIVGTAVDIGRFFVGIFSGIRDVLFVSRLDNPWFIVIGCIALVLLILGWILYLGMGSFLMKATTGLAFIQRGRGLTIVSIIPLWAIHQWIWLGFLAGFWLLLTFLLKDRVEKGARALWSMIGFELILIIATLFCYSLITQAVILDIQGQVKGMEAFINKYALPLWR